MKNSSVQIKAIKTANGFKGRILVYEGNQFLWSKVTDTESVTKDDALLTAYHLAQEIADENGMILA